MPIVTREEERFIHEVKTAVNIQRLPAMKDRGRIARREIVNRHIHAPTAARKRIALAAHGFHSDQIDIVQRTPHLWDSSILGDWGSRVVESDSPAEVMNSLATAGFLTRVHVDPVVKSFRADGARSSSAEREQTLHSESVPAEAFQSPPAAAEEAFQSPPAAAEEPSAPHQDSAATSAPLAKSSRVGTTPHASTHSTWAPPAWPQTIAIAEEEDASARLYVQHASGHIHPLPLRPLTIRKIRPIVPPDLSLRYP